MARGQQKRRGAAWLLVAALADSLALWRRGYGLGGNVIVRCRAGHLFSTLWVPAASIKAVRLGPWRVQRCPVGRHWTTVTPVDRSHLSVDQLTRAQAIRDVRIP